MKGTAALFESVRCYTRLFNDSDIDEFMIYRNNPQWMQYQGFKGLSREEFKSALLANDSLNSGLQLAIIRKSDDRLIGDLYIKKDEADYWIGYTINPVYKREGFAYEIVTAMIEWIFEQGGSRILADIDSENIPSIRFIEKIGFIKFKEDGDSLIYVCEDRQVK